MVSNENITDWFNAANLTDDKEYVGVILTKKNTTQIEVSFTSGKNNVPIHRFPQEQYYFSHNYYRNHKVPFDTLS